MRIVDNITGEILDILSKHTAMKIASQRLNYHNSKFNYSHRGKHDSANAEMTIKGNIITIDYKEDN